MILLTGRDWLDYLYNPHHESCTIVARKPSQLPVLESARVVSAADRLAVECPPV